MPSDNLGRDLFLTDLVASAPTNEDGEAATSHSHQSLRVATSLPEYEDAVTPRVCITPEPHMMLPTYEEARVIASDSKHRLSIDTEHEASAPANENGEAATSQ